jgi:hypothetical protein
MLQGKKKCLRTGSEIANNNRILYSSHALAQLYTYILSKVKGKVVPVLNKLSTIPLRLWGSGGIALDLDTSWR